MAVFLHQNLRCFGGEADPRNAAYTAAFGHIKAQLDAPAGAGSVLVAGATEIVNNGAGARAWQALARRLGLAQDEVIACGQTALAHGPEFIGLAVHPSLQVLSTARILLQPAAQSLSLHHDIADPVTPDWCGRLPAGSAPDYRGVVYVVVKSMTIAPFAVGFLHNLYTLEDQRALVAGKIPEMLALMRSNPAMHGGPGYTFLGGDFNLAPAARGTARTGQAFPYYAGITAADLLHLPHGAVAGGTTLAGSPYDYWYANLDPAVPFVPFRVRGPTSLLVGYNTTTLDTSASLGVAGPMSDHLCSLLQVS